MKDLEKKIHKFLKDRNWHKPIPADLAKSVMIEGAELLEHFQWENLTLDELKKNKEKLEEIKGEVADVLIYTIQLSVLLGFDTEKVVMAKLAKIGNKYPVEIFWSDKGSFDTQKKYPAKIIHQVKQGSSKDDLYWKIKKEYRKNK